MCWIQGVSSNVSFYGPEERLSTGGQSRQGAAMANQAPLHAVEIIFYAAASFIAVAGLAWFFLR
jgi:hypothetical protein